MSHQKSSLQHDRPRERLWAVGPHALTAAELLAILLGTGCGGEDASSLAVRLLKAGAGSLRRLAARPSAEMLQVPGVGPAKAARVVAAFELAHRVAREGRPLVLKVREPQDAVALLAPRLRDSPVEELHLLVLDTHGQVRRDHLISRGLLNGALVHPREVFRAAIAESAAGIIVVHNHPSGDPTPSPEDMAVTRQLAAAGRLLDIPLVDHILIAGDEFVSFAAEGML